MVELHGDAVIGLQASFLEDWLATTGEILDLSGHPNGHVARPSRIFRRPQSPNANPFALLPDRPMTSRGPLMQLVPSGPDLPDSNLAAQFIAAIATSQTRVWLATPYLVPDESLSLILRTSAMRGVDVRILVPTPKQSDQRLTAYAGCSYYDDFLETGCHVFEYLPGMLHAKYLIVDDICAIGSANMDIRSFYINHEITAMFYDRALTAHLAGLFSRDLKASREVFSAEREHLPLWVRLAENIARMASPLL